MQILTAANPERWAGLALVLLLVVSAVGCSGDEPDGPSPAVVVTHELSSRWKLLPHRISAMELTMQPAADGSHAVISAQNDGGSFGVVDSPIVDYAVRVWQSEQLVAQSASVKVAIEPNSSVGGEPFTVETTAELPAGALAQTRAQVAFIRGYAVTTDDYESPPSFASDPDLPYDPGDGFTTQGLGIALGDISIEGDKARVKVRVRNSLGIADRADMNAAIPHATTWVRVDFLVVGARGAAAELASEEVSYFLSTAAYGENTLHEHAEEAKQQVTLTAGAGPAHAVFGIRAFDVWLNQSAHIDPSCVVVQDEINSWDEPVSGPGRYLRDLTVRLWDSSHDPAKGTGSAKLDLFLSNSSEYKEVGNVCLGVQGQVGMLVFDDPAATMKQPEPLSLTFKSGESTTAELAF